MIYLDNAATTWPKPPEVLRAVTEAVTAYGANPGRGSYPLAEAADKRLFECRSHAARFFGTNEPERLIYTPGCTWSINTVLNGCLRPGSHIIISDLEHNAVVRPLYALEKHGVLVSRAGVVEGDEDATLRNFEKEIRRNTVMIFCTHASNVFGITPPIRRIGELCQRKGILFGVDAAQAAGTVEVTHRTTKAQFICAPAHKGLYGVMGTGILSMSADVLPEPLVRGGTGSLSARRDQPDLLPDLYESGTPAMPSICALDEGLSFVEKTGLCRILDDELKITSFIYDELKAMKGISLYTRRPEKGIHVPLLSFNIADKSSGETAERLGKMGICVRAGYHCSYDAHIAMGTQNRGTVRIAPSAFTSYGQAAGFLRAVYSCL